VKVMKSISDVDKKQLEELVKALDTDVCPKCGAGVEYVEHAHGEKTCSCLACGWCVSMDKFLTWSPI
jgi:ribosomal protein S27AE